jgi:putative ABC transport system permease protein
VFLAWREVRRAKVRFGLLAGAVGLLLFLILAQQTLQAGLVGSFVGGIRGQTADVLVYSVDGRRNLAGGVVPPDLEATIEEVEGIEVAGRLGQRTVSATAAGELVSVGLLGYEAAEAGGPRRLRDGRMPEAPGEAVADSSNGDGFALGDVIRLEPGGHELTVVGRADDVKLLVQPTLFLPYDSWLAAARSTNPDAGEPLPSAIGLAAADGTTPEELVERVNAADERADGLTREQAAAETPGVANIQQSFRIIFGLFALVVPLITGLFFLIVTFQKARALTLLRAIGAPRGRLVASLLLQVVIVVVAGVAVGLALYAPLSGLRIGAIALQFQGRAAVTWSIGLLVLSLAGAAVAARRVLAVDPVAATGGSAR